MNWHDLRYFLTIQREGTLSSAASVLKVNQTTVGRRLQQFEEDIDQKLFKRAENRLTLTEEGARLFKHAEAVEEAIGAFEQQLSVSDYPSGSLRITAVESLLNRLLLPTFLTFRQQYPDVELTLMGSRDNLEIDRFEADIAIRLARPTSGTTVISKLADVGFSLYGSRAVHPEGKYDPEGVSWAAYDEALSALPEMSWIEENHPQAHIVFRSSSTTTLMDALQFGQMVGILPCFMGDQQQSLIRLTGDHPLLSREAWIVVHKDLHHSPRLKAGINWLKSIFHEKRKDLSGYRD